MKFLFTNNSSTHYEGIPTSVRVAGRERAAFLGLVTMILSEGADVRPSFAHQEQLVKLNNSPLRVDQVRRLAQPINSNKMVGINLTLLPTFPDLDVVTFRDLALTD